MIDKPPTVSVSITIHCGTNPSPRAQLHGHPEDQKGIILLVTTWEKVILNTSGVRQNLCRGLEAHANDLQHPLGLNVAGSAGLTILAVPSLACRSAVPIWWTLEPYGQRKVMPNWARAEKKVVGRYEQHDRSHFAGGD